MAYPPVTVGILTYQKPEWLGFVLEGLAYAKSRVPFRTLVLGNSPTEEVRATGRLDVEWDSPDGLSRLGRIYAAWNETVRQAETPLVCLMNDDMYVSDYWLDELVEAYHTGPCVPTSLLVESGRIPSAVPEQVRNFGLSPEEFDAEGFREYATAIRRPGVVGEGRLYMPCLFERYTFMRLGGYPDGNPPGTTGDKDLFARFARAGYRHVECAGSVVYHVQCGSNGGYYPDA